MIEMTTRSGSGSALSESEMADDPDAVAGRAMVEARVALCSQDEQAAFWEAVRRCFGGPAPKSEVGA